MAYELIYTSAERGLRPGSTGFCTVATTSGISPKLVMLLESLTGYRPPQGLTPEQCPPAFLHYTTQESNGEKQEIVGRICACPPDHTGRSNKIAHFFVLSANECSRIREGAANAVSPHAFCTNWTGQPQQYSAPKVLNGWRGGAAPANAWSAATGDAGWAGLMAQEYLKNPRNTIYIKYSAYRQPDLLSMVSEALQLLPEQKRWKVNYNTCYLSAPGTMLCNWAFVMDENWDRIAPMLTSSSIVIDCTVPSNCPYNGELIDIARTGQAPSPIAPPHSDNVQIQSQEQAKENRNTTGSSIFSAPKPSISSFGAPTIGSLNELHPQTLPPQQESSLSAFQNTQQKRPRYTFRPTSASKNRTNSNFSGNNITDSEDDEMDKRHLMELDFELQSLQKTVAWLKIATLFLTVILIMCLALGARCYITYRNGNSIRGQNTNLIGEQNPPQRTDYSNNTAPHSDKTDKPDKPDKPGKADKTDKTDISQQNEYIDPPEERKTDDFGFVPN